MLTPRRQMFRRICSLRILGMGLGGAVVATVLWERQASPLARTALLLAALVWPHATYLLTRRTADPYVAEVCNLLIDSVLVAALVPLMYFNLSSNVMLLILTMVDKITTGTRGLQVRALWAMLAAGVVSAAVAGLYRVSETSTRVIMVCLPVTSLHMLSVSAVSYQLIRQSARQNQMLDELCRVDALTGLFGRGYWQEQVEAALCRHHTTDESACMLMLDTDHLKEINDAYGHTVGNEVIRVLAHVVRGNARAGDCAGRYGGDEFVIVLSGMHACDALATAQCICEQTEGVRLRSLSELRITSSIGVTPADHRHGSLRAWIDVADATLYVVKNGGCNQVARCMEPVLVPMAQQPALRPALGLVGGCRVYRPLYSHHATSARYRCRANLCAVTLRNDMAQCEPRAHPLELRLAVQALEHAEQGVPPFPVQQLAVRKPSTSAGVVLVDR